MAQNLILVVSGILPECQELINSILENGGLWNCIRLNIKVVFFVTFCNKWSVDTLIFIFNLWKGTEKLCYLCYV